LRGGKAIPAALVAAAIAVAGLSAHRRDELLQAARIAVEPDRLELELDLTPGIEVAEAVIAAADLDRDGEVASHEQWAYCRRVLEAIRLEVDGAARRLQPLSCRFPAVAAIRGGVGIIELTAAAAVPALPAGGHQVVFRNAFQPEGSVYLANALVPASDAVAVTAQHRDGDQRSLAIDYRIAPARGSERPVWPLGLAGGALMVMLLRQVVRSVRLKANLA
jgi:hypothetical protein